MYPVSPDTQNGNGLDIEAGSEMSGTLARSVWFIRNGFRSLKLMTLSLEDSDLLALVVNPADAYC